MNGGIAQHPRAAAAPGSAILLDLEPAAPVLHPPAPGWMRMLGEHQHGEGEEAHPGPKIVLGIHKMSHLISGLKISPRWKEKPAAGCCRSILSLEELWEAEIPAGSVGRAEPELRMMMQRCSCGISGPARSGKYQKSHEAL